MTNAATYRYRGKDITRTEIAFVAELIEAHPQARRQELSRLLCEAWGWKQANGQLRDMVCRGLLLKLHRAGEIELPPPRSRGQGRATRTKPEPVLIDESPMTGPLSGLGPVEIEPVRRTSLEPLFHSLIEQYHYLGYEQPVGEQLKYLVSAAGRPVACLAWSSAPRHLGPRDRFVGWDQTARRRNIGLVAYNTRFLILPWVKVEHLASHVLGRIAARIGRDWKDLYAHPVYLLETFVDPARFRGTCYRAANWVDVGETTGRGKDDLTHRANRTVKRVLVYPLHRRFRELMSAEQAG
jgi:Domain of unknown function (DUF4338)